MAIRKNEAGINDALANAADKAEAAFAARNPLSAEAYARACDALPGGNTRTVLHYSPFPLIIARSEGQHLTDLDGHTYLDFLGEYSAGLYGHSHPLIVEAIEDRLKDGLVHGGPNRNEAELAQAICDRFASIERVRFCNSGTEANLMALGAARAHTGRDAVLAFEGAYHGGVLYFADATLPMNAPFDVSLGTYNDAEATLEVARSRAGEIAAIIVEPMAGAGGCIPASREFLQALREFTDNNGIVLIFDEVMTSRLGPGGLQGALSITPDLTTFGKYLGGGLSFGAFGGAAAIMDRFDPRRTDALPHAGTFNNNTLSMAAGLAGLRKVFTPEAAAAHLARGETFKQRLNDLIEDRGIGAQVTGIGSLLNVHWQRGEINNPPQTALTRPEARTLFHLAMLERGIYLSRRGYMALSLALSDGDLDRFADVFADVLDRYGPMMAPAEPA